MRTVQRANTAQVSMVTLQSLVLRVSTAKPRPSTEIKHLVLPVHTVLLLV